MVYESLHENGWQPFTPDPKRGHWANPQDYIYAALSTAFRMDIFVWFASDAGVFAYFFVYGISLFLIIVPFMVIQSYLGQFSSSGILSAFRISPIFRGIGYVTLALNICILACCSIFAVIPLFYFFASLNPTLPWSCEEFKKWATNLTEEEETNLCNLNTNNKSYIMKWENDSIILEGSGSVPENESYYIEHINHHIPSVLYFSKIFNDLDFWFDHQIEFEMSWQLIICTLMVWSLVAYLLYKYFDTEVFGTLIRYGVWIIVGLMSLLLVRFCFMPSAKQVFLRNFGISWHKLIDSLCSVPYFSMSAFGPGWGLVITLSSFNRFKSDIIKSSWLIAVGQMFIISITGLLLNFTEEYIGDVTNGKFFPRMDYTWVLYLSSGSVMAHMEWANMWSILFYLLLFLSALLMIVLQLKSILTTIYDEFVFLREKRLQVSISLLGFLCVSSLYFTSNHGLSYASMLALDTFIAQNGINLLVIIVVLWIYGRERFQRDFEFMTDRPFSTWFVNILRFVTPCSFLYGVFTAIYIAEYEHTYSHVSADIIILAFLALPWLCIPGYGIYQMSLVKGTNKTRFYKCCHPVDWLPVEMEHRQKYGELVGSVKTSQAFNEMKNQDELQESIKKQFELTLPNPLAILYIKWAIFNPPWNY